MLEISATAPWTGPALVTPEFLCTSERLYCGRSTCGGRLLYRPCLHASLGKVLVNQVEEHGGHIVLAALVPVAVHCQPVAQVPGLLPCSTR